MEENLTIVVTVLFAVLLLVLMPLFNTYERQDDMAYEFALSSVTSLCDDVMQSGYLSRERYRRFLNELDATGNTYEVRLEAQKKVYNRLNAEEVALNYYIDYTRQILDEIEKPFIDNDESSIKSAAYLLESGDYFFAKVRNTNMTQATIFFQAIGGMRDKVKIKVDYGGIVKASEWKDSEMLTYVPSTSTETEGSGGGSDGSGGGGIVVPIVTINSDPAISNGGIIDKDATVKFTASVTPPEGTTVSYYSWKIIQAANTTNNTGTSEMTVDFTTAGNYQIAVKAKFSDGTETGESTLSFTVVETVIDPPIIMTSPVALTSGDTIGPQRIGFKALGSSLMGESIVSYRYSWTDGTDVITQIISPTETFYVDLPSGKENKIEVIAQYSNGMESPKGVFILITT